MRTPLFAMAVAVLFLHGGSAFAGSVGDALKSFGLLGTWSPDCAQNPKDPLPNSPQPRVPLRFIYTTAYFAAPKLTRILHAPGALVVFEYEITSADIITASKLKYSQAPTTVQFTTQFGVQPTQQSNELASNVVVEKVGEKMRIDEQINSEGTIVVREGIQLVGAKGAPVSIPEPWFERCLD